MKYVQLNKKTMNRKERLQQLNQNASQNVMSDYQRKENSIVRQSSLKFTQDYCRSVGLKLTLKEMIGITNVIVDYCSEGYTKELVERLDKVDSYLQSKFEDIS